MQAFNAVLLSGLVFGSSVLAQTSSPVPSASASASVPSASLPLSTSTVPLPTATPSATANSNNTNGTETQQLVFEFNLPIPLEEGNDTSACEGKCVQQQYGLCTQYDADCFCSQARMDSVNCCLNECAPGVPFPRVDEYLAEITQQCTVAASVPIWIPSGCGTNCTKPTNGSCLPPPEPHVDAAGALSVNMFKLFGTVLGASAVLAIL